MLHALSTRDINIINSGNAAVPTAKPKSPQARPLPLLVAPRRQDDFVGLAIAFVNATPDQQQRSLHSLVHGHDRYADPALRAEMLALRGKRDRHPLRAGEQVSPAFCLQAAYQLVLATGHCFGTPALNGLARLWGRQVVPTGQLTRTAQAELVGLAHGILPKPVSPAGRHFVASRETVQRIYRAALEEAQHQFMDKVRLRLTPLLDRPTLDKLARTPVAMQPKSWAVVLRDWCRSEKEQPGNECTITIIGESLFAARKFKQDIENANWLLATFQQAEVEAVCMKLPHEARGAAAMIGTAVQSGQDTLARELFSKLLAGHFSSRKARREVPKSA